jgi:hypothetical protein
MNVPVHPMIKVSNQLVAAPAGSDVTVQCYVEASPKAMNSWHRETGEQQIFFAQSRIFNNFGCNGKQMFSIFLFFTLDKNIYVKSQTWKMSVFFFATPVTLVNVMLHEFVDVIKAAVLQYLLESFVFLQNALVESQKKIIAFK